MCKRPRVSKLLPVKPTEEETQKSSSGAGVLHTGNIMQVKNDGRVQTGQMDSNLHFVFVSLTGENPCPR